jgi:hypothetical protein
VSIEKRQSAEDRNIEAARRLRKLQGARYGDNKKTFVELSINDRQFVVIHDAKPENAQVQEFTVQDDLRVRVIEAGSLVSIGNGRFAEGGDEDRHGLLPISYDGAGTFWWFKASPVADVASAIRDDALRLVDRVLSRTTWRNEQDALVTAREVLSLLNGSYAVLPDSTILTGSAAPGFRPVDNGQQLFLEVFDKRSDGLRSALERDSASGREVPVAFGILEYAAAEEFLERTAERTSDRNVVPHALVELRDTAWVKDFTHNRERWADGGFFTDYVSTLNKHIAFLRPRGNKALDAAIADLQFHTKVSLHDHDAVNAKLDEVLNLRDLLLESEPRIDDLLAERLKWPYKVKPLELLEIRARGLRELIAEPELSPSP